MGIEQVRLRCPNCSQILTVPASVYPERTVFKCTSCDEVSTKDNWRRWESDAALTTARKLGRKFREIETAIRRCTGFLVKKDRKPSKPIARWKKLTVGGIALLIFICGATCLPVRNERNEFPYGELSLVTTSRNLWGKRLSKWMSYRTGEIRYQIWEWNAWKKGGELRTRFRDGSVFSGPISESGKRHGRCSYWDGKNYYEENWYWYGEEITEGEWHIRNH